MRSFAGVNVAAVTPHGKRGDEPDIAATLELIDFLCGAGVDGIALLGTTGEFAHFHFNDRIRLVYLGVKRSRVPVMAGVSHSTLDGALALGREATEAGAAGLLLMPPYFFRYSQPEIRQFYLRFAAEIGQGVPVYLYNIPAVSSAIAKETALDLLGTGQFAGIKDSSGDWDLFVALQNARQQTFTLLMGHETLFSRALASGADGVISGIASAIPELIVALNKAVRQGDGAEIARLDARLQQFLAAIEPFPAPVALKAVLAVRGLKTGSLAVPLAPETEARLDKFREWFRAWL